MIPCAPALRVAFERERLHEKSECFNAGNAAECGPRPCNTLGSGFLRAWHFESLI